MHDDVPRRPELGVGHDGLVEEDADGNVPADGGAVVLEPHGAAVGVGRDELGKMLADLYLIRVYQ